MHQEKGMKELHILVTNTAIIFFFLNSDLFCFEKPVKFHCIQNTDMA